MAACAEAEAARELAGELESRGLGGARVALVLGSGLGAFAERLEGAVAVPFAELRGMPRSAVPGHAGRFVAGTVEGVRVLAQQGRVHLYEGWSAAEVTRSTRAFALLGVEAVLLTNAAGGLRREWPPATLVRLTDHLALQGEAPLARGEAAAGAVYDEGLGRALDRAAREAGVELHHGVYAALQGPAYETPAEIRMLSWMGADVVGMSTAAEAVAARAAGMRVAAVSCVTNHAAGIAPHPLRHEDVVDAGMAAATSFTALLARAAAEIARELGSSGARREDEGIS